MRFALICTDKADHLEMRKANRDAHLVHIANSGVVEMAGPFLTETGEMAGSLVILNVDTLDQARDWAAARAIGFYAKGCIAGAVAALAKLAVEDGEHAAARLGVINRFYTVYLDLVMTDARGAVIASANPRYHRNLKDKDLSSEAWFRSARNCRSGDDYIVDTVKRSGCHDNRHVLVYATGIRAGGRTDGALVGTLGVYFDWQAQAQTVVDGVRLTPDEKARTRVLLLDQKHRVLAASDGVGVLSETVKLDVAGGAMALINSMGALGSFGGSYLVGYLNSSTGSPGASYLLMSGALMLSVVMMCGGSLIIACTPGRNPRPARRIGTTTGCTAMRRTWWSLRPRSATAGSRRNGRCIWPRPCRRPRSCSPTSPWDRAGRRSRRPPIRACARSA